MYMFHPLYHDLDLIMWQVITRFTTSIILLKKFLMRNYCREKELYLQDYSFVVSLSNFLILATGEICFAQLS